jgi:hypothetical protein
MIFGRKESHQLEVGCEVQTADGEVLGAVSALADDAFEVTGGTLDRQHTWRVPRSAVAKIDDEAVHLSSTRAQVMGKGWELPAGAAGAGQEISPAAQ